MQLPSLIRDVHSPWNKVKKSIIVVLRLLRTLESKVISVSQPVQLHNKQSKTQTTESSGKVKGLLDILQES